MVPDTPDVETVLFGAEELGLYGSRDYVQTLSDADRRGILGMINLDMVGVGDAWRFGGTDDLVPGKLRVKKGGGAAGHNGLRSMDRMLGAQDYWRVRLGIGHPGTKERVLGYVLGNFGSEDKAWLIALLDAVADAAGLLAQGKPADFMTNVALQTQDLR